MGIYCRFQPYKCGYTVSTVRFDGSALEVAQGMAAENLHISPQFVLDVISGQTCTDASKLAFRDPDTFVAGNIHACFPVWERIAKIAPFKFISDTILDRLSSGASYGVRSVTAFLHIWLCL